MNRFLRYSALALILIAFTVTLNAEILIPMDRSQTDHLKAYGIAFHALTIELDIQWLLNYRGGSWLIPASPEIERLCNVRGVRFERVSPAEIAQIYSVINESNMDTILLEKEPKVAIYTPPNTLPWDDAVTLAMTYAEIDYDTVYDEEVLAGVLDEYDWLHLHHEDFTGQYGKFYASYRNTPWYREDVRMNEAMAARLGYSKVWQLKHDVAMRIREYVERGGFLFAMCAAIETIEVALTAYGVDIVEAPFDGDGIERDYQSKLDFSRTFATENFSLVTNPYIYSHSSLDTSDYARLRGAEQDFFVLFDFSAKFDPVPTMLTQNHNNTVNGFLGQTTGFHKKYLKSSVIILGESPGEDEVKYLHGNLGKGTYTFYGGHDPEDYAHRVGDPETNLALHKSSPGYRLILNNVLFPAAEKRELKTFNYDNMRLEILVNRTE